MDEETYIDPEVKELHKALHIAWVLLGRCDMALEQLELPYTSAKSRHAIIEKMRAEILHAMGSAQ